MGEELILVMESFVSKLFCRTQANQPPAKQQSDANNGIVDKISSTHPEIKQNLPKAAPQKNGILPHKMNAEQYAKLKRIDKDMANNGFNLDIAPPKIVQAKMSE